MYSPWLATVYESSILASTKQRNAAQDLWNNVKIPDLAFVSRNQTPSIAGWYNVLPEQTAYSSLLGIPVIGVPQTGNTTFALETSYFAFACQQGTFGRTMPIVSRYDGDDTLIEPLKRDSETFGGPGPSWNWTAHIDGSWTTPFWLAINKLAPNLTLMID